MRGGERRVDVFIPHPQRLTAARSQDRSGAIPLHKASLTQLQCALGSTHTIPIPWSIWPAGVNCFLPLLHLSVALSLSHVYRPLVKFSSLKTSSSYDSHQYSPL